MTLTIIQNFAKPKPVLIPIPADVPAPPTPDDPFVEGVELVMTCEDEPLPKPHGGGGNGGLGCQAEDIEP